MKTRAKPIDGYLDGDLHLIMMAVQKLVDEACPPDDMGLHAYTPAILDRAQDVQDAICETLKLPKRPLIAPDDFS